MKDITKMASTGVGFCVLAAVIEFGFPDPGLKLELIFIGMALCGVGFGYYAGLINGKGVKK